MTSSSAVPKLLYLETGRRIQAARKKAGISQERLADAIGLSRASVSNIERGRHNVLLHTLEDIGRALGVDPHDLLPSRRQGVSKLEAQVPPDTSPDLKEFIRGMEKRLTRESKRTTAS